ncbi:hypothetical protein [Gordonia sp. UCD-TK1]|uniref:hypothetical protein n=1 Tax=Gordonia sp. UCD-TK1 TaxID=1857893 RepID=UPI001111E97B|nr:hypothetical protein [Gordonia sp. UCD-TK1]
MGYATLQLIPSMQGTSARMGRELSGPMAQAGRAAGRQMGQAIASGVSDARAAVQKAAQQVTAARNKEADAAGKLRVAEAQLQSLRERGVTDAGRLAAAEERVSSARRRSEASTRETQRATNNLTESNRRAAEAQRRGASSADEAGRSMGRMGSAARSARGHVAGLAGLMAAGFGVAQIAGFVKESVTSLQRIERINQQTATVVQSTGGAARVSAQHVIDLAGAMENLTATEAETVQEGANFLLTFKNIRNEAGRGNDIFDQTTKAMVDLSRATGTDMRSASLQLGKALNDPVKGLSALSRVGITFDKSQQDMIKGMVAAGDTMGAQKIILRELNSQFGGSAENFAQTTQGRVELAKHAIGTFGETITQSVLPIIGRFATVAANALNGLATNWPTILQRVKGFFAPIVPVFNEISGGFRAFVAAFRDGGDDVTSSGLAGFLEGLGVHARNSFDIFTTYVVPALKTAGGVIRDVGAVVLPVLLTALTKVVTVAGTVSGAIGNMIGFVVRNREVFAAVAGVIAALFLPALITMGVTMAANAATMGVMAVGMTAYSIAQKAIAIGTRVWAAAQWVLNAALTANPIGIVIAVIAALVAGIILAYRNSETFRNIVQAAWNGIKTAVGAVWNWLSTTVFPFFKAALSAIGTAAMWLWNNAIMPAFNGIKAVIGFVWGGIKFYFDAFMATMRLIGSVVAWLWNNAIVPAFNGIKAAAQFMWTGISVIFGWFKAGIGAVGQIVGAVVDTVIKPAWNAVKTAADFMWGGIKQIFDWIKSGWNLLATGIRTVVDTIIKPAFEGIKTALRAVGDFFGTVVDGIKTAWDKLKGFVATPINFVINTVWNNGLLKAWNTIAGFLPGLKQMSPLSPVAFAEGGSVPMTRGARRGKDSVSALLMPEEHVWDVRDVAKSGGQGAQYRMRDMISRGQPFTWTPNGLAAPSEGGPLARFAEGGAVEAGQKLAPVAGEGGLQSIAVLMRRLIFKMWPKIKDIGGYRQDAYPEHPSGRALDVMVGSDKKTGDQVNAFAHANNPKFPLTHSIWQQSMWYPPNMRREPMEDRGSPTQNHMDHPHLWWQPQNVDPNVVPEGLVTSGFGGPSEADMMNIIKRKITEIIDKALQPIKDGIAAVIGSPPPEWLGIPPKALDITKTKAIETAFDLAGKLGEKLQGAYDAAKKVTSTITNAVTAPGRWVGGLFRDQGGFLPTGKSVVTNETGKPEAVLNWQQLARIKELMANGVSLAQAATEVGVSPDAAQKALDTNAAGGGDALSRKQERERSELDIQRKHKDALDKLRDEYERNKKAPGAKDDYENKKRALERAYEDDRLKRKQDYETREAGLKEQEKQKAGTAGSGDPSASGEEQKPGRMKSFVELGRDAGGIIAGGIAETLGLPTWLTDPASALQGDDGSNVRVTDSGAAAGNSAITGNSGGSYSDPTYGDGSTVTPGQAPLSKMPDLGSVEGMPSISYNPSGGAEQWRPLAQWAIDYVNQSMKGPAQLQAMVEQIGDESGGNPKAQNNYDINAQNGVPSGGLLQVIEPTFQANRDPKLPNDKFHPGANLVAALRYYVPKYGKDLTARWGKGKGGYKFGGYTGNLGVNQLAGFVHGQEFVTSAGPTRKNIHLLELIQSGADVESALIGGYEQWGSVADRAPRQLAAAGSGSRTTNITVFGNTAGDIANEIGRKEWRGSGGYGSRER